MKFIQLTPEDLAALMLALYQEGWRACDDGEPEPTEEDVTIEPFLQTYSEKYH